jgi:hypothetical protein
MLQQIRPEDYGRRDRPDAALMTAFIAQGIPMVMIEDAHTVRWSDLSVAKHRRNQSLFY